MIRLGLRARIAAAVLISVMVPSVIIAAISYLSLAHSATATFETTASDEATDALFASSNQAQLAQGAPLRDSGPVSDAFDAAFQSRFDGINYYAVALLKPGPDGKLAFSRSRAGDSDRLHTTASPAVVAATQFTDYLNFGSGSVGPHREYLTVQGHRWLVAGGDIDTLPISDHPLDRIILVQYHDVGSLDAKIAAYRRYLVAQIVVPMLAAGAFAWFVAGRVQRPVRVAADVARRLGDGDRDARLPVQGRDEMAALSGNFNTMADRLTLLLATLEASEARQRRFVADVSHELRTPMTTLVAAAAALEDPATRDRAAALVAPQLRNLNRLTSDLIETSLIDSGTVELEREPVDVAALVAEVVARSTDPSAFQVSSDGDCVLAGDPRRLHTVLRNLTANALVHGRPPVRITVLGSAQAVTVRVADEGPGIPAELDESIFDRFVRGDPARSGSDGSGLGLSLARDLTELHGGTVTASAGPGAVITLCLPKIVQPTLD